MGKDLQDTVRGMLSSALDTGGGKSRGAGKGLGSGLSGVKGLAAGAGAAVLAPVAAKALAKAAGVGGISDVVKAPAKGVSGVASDLGDHVGGSVGDKMSEKLDEAGGPSGILKDTVRGLMPFGGGGGNGGVPGVGKGRRMPVQQSVDIGAPIETVYNQWTQFEQWPRFMHRVISVDQRGDEEVAFTTKIWGRKKEFTAHIETQRPDERVKWSVRQGITHTGVVTFHELGPNLTRVLLGMDVEPGGMLEKVARGMRHVKRAARADLHRFKALVEMSGMETGAWRGVIEDGEVVEEHDPSYDEEREYADIDDLVEESEDEDEDVDEDEEDAEPEAEEDEDPEAEEDEEPEAEEDEEPEAEEDEEPEAESDEDLDEEDLEEEPDAEAEPEEEPAPARSPSRRSRGRGANGSSSAATRRASSHGRSGRSSTPRRTRQS